MRTVLASAACLFLAGGVMAQDDGSGTKGDAGALYQNAVVAADHPLASRAGVEMLRQGGNVVDAAVATAFTLSVVRPYSSGVGGGGFMVIWDAERQQAIALDYRERAPRSAHRDMFVDPENPGRALEELSRKGHLAVAVPGQVAGLCFALEKYGTLDLDTVLQPAIRLAREGVPVDEHDRTVQATVFKEFEEHPKYHERYAVLYEKYLNNGKPWQPGERFHSPQLKLLETLAKHGPEAFYRGPIADAIVAEIQRGGGLIARRDLVDMAPAVREPLRGEHNGLGLVTMPPPSSGGIALIETLHILSAWEKLHPAAAIKPGDVSRPEYLHLLTEALKHAFADRAEFLGDADFAAVPVERLTSREYAEVLAGRIDADRTKPLTAYGRYLPSEDAGTTHFSVMDREGNAVACTETINLLYGSFVVEPEYGIVFNNEMDDFAALPGQANAFGLIQGEANAVGPRKRPLSSMTPTIVLEDGQAVYALGGSGGPRIISGTIQVFLNLTEFGMPPTDAVRHRRIHHQWVPNSLFVEDPLFGEIREPMEQRGHDVKRRNELAAVQAVARTPRGLIGASDPRKGGAEAGY